VCNRAAFPAAALSLSFFNPENETGARFNIGLPWKRRLSEPYSPESRRWIAVSSVSLLYSINDRLRHFFGSAGMT
jgi:hypothetical protein